MTEREILEAEESLSLGLARFDEQNFFLETRALQRQPKYLTLTVKEILQKFEWMKNVS